MTSNPLVSSARSAYRSILRASAKTFVNDPTVLRAFRSKIRSEYFTNLPISNAAVCQEKVQLVHEIADFLRKNVAQAVRLRGPEGALSEERWQLRITEETELGNNENVKSTSAESSRSARKKQNSTGTGCCQADGKSTVPRYYSQLKKAHKQRQVPELKEDDLEESFVRGSGPGGQSINKTENNVQLLHIPTGIRVCCQETRSLELNRKFARRLLLEKLDALQNPGLSKQDLKRALKAERHRRRKKKAKKKANEEEADPREHISSEGRPGT